jgi:hypothetical protein
MVQIAILLLDLLAGRASAQVVCDAINVVQAFETPANVARVVSLLRELGAKLEPALEKEVRAVAHWLATRPASEWGPADYGGNVPAAFGSGPPVATRPEPDEGADLGGNVRARPESPGVVRDEPEDGRDPQP